MSSKGAMAKPLSGLLAYREHLKDALTGKPITAQTQLVSLFQPNPGSAEGALIASLTGIAYPAKPCTLIARGACFPPRDFNGAPPYQLYLTCNRLLTAPTLRLECVWKDQHLLVALEFPFHDGPNRLSGLTFRRDIERHGSFADEARFTAGGASSEGLNVARYLGVQLGAAGQQVLNELGTYIANTTSKEMRLRFDTSLEDNRYAMSSILPYITDTPLPSLSAPEWAALMPLQPERDFQDMMSNPAAPFPMVPFQGRDTFASATHAAVEYYESSRVGWLEQKVVLEEWASVSHRGLLLRVGSQIALAIRFSSFRRLGSPAGIQKFELPDRFLAKVDFEGFIATCERSPVPIELHWPYDALFVLRRPCREFRDAAVEPALINNKSRPYEFDFRPVMPESQLRVKLSTARSVQISNDRWQKIILNQDHSSLPLVDLATGCHIEPSGSGTRALHAPAIEEAFRWMLKWRNWNAEQLEALASVREAVGGLVLISGPAGTGKTLIIQALAAFFYFIGLHVLVLAPANSNLSDFMGKLKELFGERSSTPVKATRVYPTSADFSPKKISQGHTCVHSPESTAQENGDVLEFEMVRSDLQYTDDKYTSHKDYGLPAQVFRAARVGNYELFESIARDEEKVDVWTELRQFMQQSAAGAFDWHSGEKVERYQKVYELCKAHYLAHVQMVCTTTGNVQCRDIVENWAANKHGTETKGIVVILDEACKDNEIDSVSALLYPEWRQKINGMVMLGDERQLEPTNMGAKGQQVFNAFNDRISMPLMSRLKRQGFPCYQLLEQHRMSHHIAEWPFKEFYPRGMRNGPGTFMTLRNKLPGLFNCLTEILRDLGTVFNNPLMTDVEHDRSVRTHYLEIIGTRDNSKRSAFVLEHVRFFCDKIYWGLRAYFVEKTNEKVLVICAYKEAKHCYEDAMRYLQQKYHIPDCQLPRIATIDSSQGAEAPFTIIDCSVQRYDPNSRLADLGFVDDDRRMNVAMTRAQEVRWFLGGRCNTEKRILRQPNTPAYVRYKESISSFSGELTGVGAPWPRGRLRKDGNDWLKGLHQRHALASTKYSDDVPQQIVRI